jgi:hypothetical protein
MGAGERRGVRGGGAVFRLVLSSDSCFWETGPRLLALFSTGNDNLSWLAEHSLQNSPRWDKSYQLSKEEDLCQKTLRKLVQHAGDGNFHTFHPDDASEVAQSFLLVYPAVRGFTSWHWTGFQGGWKLKNRNQKINYLDGSPT